MWISLIFFMICLTCCLVMTKTNSFSFNLCCFKSFIEDYSFLFRFRSTDILTDGVLDQIPIEWLNCFREFGCDVVESVINLRIQRQWPVSLRRFVARCIALQLRCRHTRRVLEAHRFDAEFKCRCAFESSRGADVRVDVLCVNCDSDGPCDTTALSGWLSGVDGPITASTSVSSSSELFPALPDRTPSCSEHERLQRLSREALRGVSSKKQHELGQLTGVLDLLCRSDQRFDCVFDIGAGLGYVGESVRVHCRLPCLSVECSDTCVTAATVRRRRLSFCRLCLRHVVHRLSHACTAAQLTSSIAEFARSAARCRCFPALSVRRRRCYGSLWTALHACGSLSPQIVRLFAESSSAAALLLISCCYHKMTHSSGRDHTADSDWTLSDILRSRLLNLTTSGLRLAAERSPTAFLCLSSDERCRHWRAVTWRAALSLVVRRCNEEASRSLVAVSQRRRHAVHKYASFREYALSAITQLSTAESVDATSCTNAATNSSLHSPPSPAAVGNSAEIAGSESRECSDASLQTASLCCMTTDDSNNGINGSVRVDSTVNMDCQSVNKAVDSKLGFISADDVGGSSARSLQLRSDIETEELNGQCVSTSHPDLLLKSIDSVECLLESDKCRDDDRAVPTTVVSCSQRCSDIEWRVQVLSSLQMCCQPVLETMVLLDRLLYLREQSAINGNAAFRACFVKIFDSRLSPRCWALLALR